MYQSFWDIFYDTKLASYYYQFYSLNARRKKTIVSALCLLASSALLFKLSQGASFRSGWIVIIFICQLVSVLQPLFPYEKQYHAACYIYEDINQLCDEMEAYWRTINTETNDDEINQKIVAFTEKYDRIEQRFATADIFPQKNWIYNKAKNNTDTYFGRFQ